VADNSNDIGTYVKLGNGLNVDLSHGFVEPTKGLFVREAFADVVKQAEQSTEETMGKYVKPASPRSLASYDVAVYVRAQGTSGGLTRATSYNGQRVVEFYNYIRPTAKYAYSVLSAVAVAKELTDRGVPWTALVIVYPTPGTRIKKPRVLHVKGIWAYYIRYHTTAGVRAYPEVRFYFTRHVLGLRKETPYTFDLIIMYSSRQVQKAVTRKELVEKAMEQTPPPSIAVVPAQSRAQPRQKAKAPAVAKAVAQPTTAVTTPQVQVEVVPQQPTTVVTAQQQPNAVPARPQAPAQPPAPRPASISTGHYVTQDLSFVKEVISSPNVGDAMRKLRDRLGNKYVKQA
jgi:hypothetical protein